MNLCRMQQAHYVKYKWIHHTVQKLTARLSRYYRQRTAYVLFRTRNTVHLNDKYSNDKDAKIPCTIYSFKRDHADMDDDENKIMYNLGYEP